MKYLINRASAISPREDLDELIKSEKKLRIKLGIDPTAPDVTLGWYAIPVSYTHLRAHATDS